MYNNNCDPYTSNCTSMYCSPGCSYSNLQNNFCPLSCTAECFNKCNQSLYCAPGCSYYDLDGGQCILCPNRCLQYCNLEGLCTSSCTSSHCSKNCPSICCEYHNGFSSSDSILSWVIPIIIVSAIFLCIMFTVLLCRVKKSNPVRPINHNDQQIDESQQEINNLVQQTHLHPIKYKKSSNSPDGQICTIDLSEISEGEDIILTPCLHIFHFGCIKQWLESNNREKICPNCKFNLIGYSI